MAAWIVQKVVDSSWIFKPVLMAREYQTSLKTLWWKNVETFKVQVDLYVCVYQKTYITIKQQHKTIIYCIMKY